MCRGQVVQGSGTRRLQVDRVSLLNAGAVWHACRYRGKLPTNGEAAIVQSRCLSAHGLLFSRPLNSLPGHPRLLAAQPVRFPCICTGSLLSP